MKIQKGRSDAEMLGQAAEKHSGESFETAVLPEEKTPVKPAAPLLSLPDDLLAKLDKAALRLRIKLKQQGVEEVKWRVSEQDCRIILSVLPKKPGGPPLK